MQKTGRLLHVCVKTTGLTMTCVLHASVSAKVLLLCQSTFEAKLKTTAVEKAAHHLMEMLLTHTGQLLQTCFYGGAFVWFSASSWGPSCCPFSLTSFHDSPALSDASGSSCTEKRKGPAPGKGFHTCGLYSSLCFERDSMCQ